MTNHPSATPKASPTVAVEVKPIWQSKTFWVGVLQTLIAILTFMPTVEGVVPDTWLRYVLLASGVLTIVLRQLTEQPVAVDGDLQKKAALISTARSFRRGRNGTA